MPSRNQKISRNCSDSLKPIITIQKGALSLFFFNILLGAFGQEIFWKGKELQSGNYKTIEGEITIRTPEDTIRASKAILYNQPKKAILKGNLSLVRTGALVTGDSGIYYPASRTAEILGHAIITTREGEIRSQAFLYDLQSKQLSSRHPTEGTANGIRFRSDRSVLYPGTRNMKLIGNAVWENDTLKGLADTLYLDKASGLLKMSRKAQILFKKKQDRVAGSYIELDLNTSKITRIEGSEIRRQDIKLKAKKITQNGDDYDLKGDVRVQSVDSSLESKGTRALIRKDGMDMTGPTVTRLVDKEKQEIYIHSPLLISRKEDPKELYYFYRNTNIRGQFEGYCDSLFVSKTGDRREIFLYRNSHIQNDSLYLEGDTLELYQDSLVDIIRAKRNALMVMITQPNRVNTISAAFIQLTKRKDESEMYARGDSDSWLWNDEKSNVGLNHTVAPEQRARIVQSKISRVTTKGTTSSAFKPIDKADLGYVDVARVKLRETYAADTLSPGLVPVPYFLDRKGKKKSVAPGTKGAERE